MIGKPMIDGLMTGGPVVLDGGLATELERRGNDLSDRLWSASLLIDAPGEIVATHLAYYRAGAQVAITASYQASFEGFAARGIDHATAADLLRRSVALADEARVRYRADVLAADGHPGDLLVAASVGPIGAARADGSEYRGDHGLGVDELADWHRERLAVLASAGPDLLACETIATVTEAEALVRLLDESDGPPAWLAFTCADARTTHGDDPVEAAFALADRSARVVAVGVNCTDPRFVDELVARARATTDKPIVVYPNKGDRWDAVARAWRSSGRPFEAGSALAWLEAGASVVGGCCGIGPEDIGAIAALVVGTAPGAGQSATGR